MLKNLKIGKRLIVSFIIIAVIASVAGVTGAFLLNKANNEYNYAIENYGFAQGNIGILMSCINESGATVRDVIFQTDPEDVKAAQVQLEGIMTAFGETLIKVEPTLTSPDEESAFKNITDNYSEYQDDVTTVIKLGLENRHDEALSYFKENAEPHLVALQNAASDLMTVNIQLGNKMVADLQGQRTVGLLIIISLIAVSLILSLVFAIFISKGISKPIEAVEIAATKMAAGELDVDLPENNSRDEIGIMIASFREATQMIKDYIWDITRGLGEIEKGNFNIQSTKEFKGDFIEIEKSIDGIATSLSETLSKIHEAANQVSSGSDQVSNTSQALSQGATEQASAIQELSANISEISDQIKNNAGNATLASEKSGLAGAEIEKSNIKMNEMVASMEDITNRSNEISKIIKAIDDIAFQTNILALNAAVEAARAGAAGKGFAVVADEVRNLAGKSAEAAKNTALLIEESINAVQAGSKIADETAQSLNATVDLAKDAVDLINEIADASNEQSVAVSQINLGVEQISAVVQSNSATAEESAAASEELSGQATVMRDLVNRFQLRGSQNTNYNNVTQYEEPDYSYEELDFSNSKY